MANEKRLIDADGIAIAIKFVANQVAEVGDYTKGYKAGLLGAVRAIEDIGSVDAVEVVRCKDCKYAKPSHKGWKHCTEIDIILGEEEFCSYGERIADNENL